MRGDHDSQDSGRFTRRDPDALLRKVQAAERAERRGQLKIFLGYTSGVGKSFRMFDEGRRRRDRGEDVIIGAMQPWMDPQVEQLASGLESIPVQIVDEVPVLDVAAIRTRRPYVCLVDGLAYNNPAGSRHDRRYRDVEDLLESGISVLTTINLEYVDEQQEAIRAISGRVPNETVPQDFLTRADELVIVDAPVGASPALDPAHLSQLRQRALLLAADAVDHQLEDYLRLNGIQSTWGTQERILVCMTPRANASVMLASGRRNADRFHGELFAVYVNQPQLTAEDRSALARNVTLARAQHAQVEVLDGKDTVRTILAFARDRGITQLFVGHNLHTTWRTRWRGSLLDRLIDRAEGLDVRVFPH